MRNPSHGWNITSSSTKGRSSRSLTIDIFSTMLQVGFSSWIGDMEFPGKETIRHGLSKRDCGWRRKRKPKRNGKKRCSANWNGFECRRKDGMRKVKRESTPTRHCSAMKPSNEGKI